jgi:hypothetical protein
VFELAKTGHALDRVATLSSHNQSVFAFTLPLSKGRERECGDFATKLCFFSQPYRHTQYLHFSHDFPFSPTFLLFSPTSHFSSLGLKALP